MLLGKRDLTHYGALVDPLTKSLLDHQTLQVIATGLEREPGVKQPTEPPEPGIITKKKLISTDDELFKQRY